MIGSIHDCVVALKLARAPRVLLRRGDQYQLLPVNSVAGIQALDPLHYDPENTIGLFTPAVACSVVYEAAGEPVPEPATAEEWAA